MEITDRPAQNDEEMEDEETEDSQAVTPKLGQVVIEPPGDFDRDAYKIIEEENRVAKVLEEVEEDDDGITYTVLFGDTRHEKVSYTSDLHQRRSPARACDPV
jgi:hypothetical protein